MMRSMTDLSYVEFLPIGIVQTTLENNVAWPRSSRCPAMSSGEDAKAWHEICKAMRALHDDDFRPRLLVFPELSLPRTRLDEFEHLVAAVNAIAVVGVDYRLNRRSRTARNEGVVFVPRNFFRKYPSRHCTRVVFGKTYPAPKERELLLDLTPPWKFLGDHNVYVFACAQFGSIGVSICYDFMYIERALMYRGRIQHLFVLAYNRDLEMFRSLAQSLCRTVFCNVVVCNTGRYGGSLAVSPYYRPYQRILYAHDGDRLFTTQVVQLPVLRLIQAQRREVEKNISEKAELAEFKDLPPGFCVSGP